MPFTFPATPYYLYNAAVRDYMPRDAAFVWRRRRTFNIAWQRLRVRIAFSILPANVSCSLMRRGVNACPLADAGGA